MGIFVRNTQYFAWLRKKATRLSNFPWGRKQVANANLWITYIIWKFSDIVKQKAGPEVGARKKDGKRMNNNTYKSVSKLKFISKSGCNAELVDVPPKVELLITSECHDRVLHPGASCPTASKLHADIANGS